MVELTKPMPMVRTSSGHFVPWDRKAIVKSLLKETMLAEKFFDVRPITKEEAEAIALEVENKIRGMGLKFVSGPLIREIVNNVLLEKGAVNPIYRIYRNIYTRVGAPVFDAYEIDIGKGFEAKENANLQPNAETTHKKKADKMSKEEYLLLMPLHLADAHLKGDIHIHDLEYFGTRPFCLSEDTVVVARVGGKLELRTVGELFGTLDYEPVGDREVARPVGVEVLTPKGFVEVGKVTRRRASTVLRIVTERGRFVELTGDHLVPTADGALVPAKELRPGARLLVLNGLSLEDLGQPTAEVGGVEAAPTLVKTVGHFIADGNHDYDVGDFYNAAFTFDKRAEAPLPDFTEALSEPGWRYSVGDHLRRGNASPQFFVGGKEATTLLEGPPGVSGGPAPLKALPAWAISLPRERLVELLTALIESCGNLYVSRRSGCIISLSSTSRVLIQQVHILLSLLGIKAYVQRHIHAGARARKKAGGEIVTRHDVWTVAIQGKGEVEKALELGLVPPRLREKVAQWVERGQRKRLRARDDVVKGVEEVPYSGYVYDIYLNDVHVFYAGSGIVVHNCQDWDLRYFFYYGFMPDGMGIKTSVARAAQRPEVAVLHSVKILAAAQTNFAGGEGFYNYLVFLAPYMRGLNYKHVKQLMQMMFFELTQMYIARGGQPVFSVHRDVPVLVINDGSLKVKPIGEFYSRGVDAGRDLDVEVKTVPALSYSFNSELKIKPVKVNAVIRHRVSEPMYSLYTKRGIVHGISGGHSVFTFKDGRVVPISVLEVKHKVERGEKVYLLAPRRIPVEDETDELDVCRLVREAGIDELVRVPDPVGFKKALMERFGRSFLKGFEEAEGVKRATVRGAWLRHGKIPLKYYVKYVGTPPSLVVKGDSQHGIEPKLRGKRLEDLLKLMAWYISEGGAGKNKCEVWISQSRGDKLNELLELAREFGFGRAVHDTGGCVQVHVGGLVGLILRKLCGERSSDKRIPGFLMKLTRQLRITFLEALLEGDGYYNKGSQYIDYTTVSPSLASSLTALLLTLDIQYVIYEEPPGVKGRNPRYVIRIFRDSIEGKDRARILVPFTDEVEVKLLKDLSEAKNPREKARIRALIRNGRRRGFITLDKCGEAAPDVLLTPVFKVEEFRGEGDGYEYDISVHLPENENFIGGIGQIFLHNSNIQITPGVPEIWRDVPIVARGRVGPDKYGDYEDEVRMLYRAVNEVALEGDYWGKPFNFPKLENGITPDMFNPRYEEEWLLAHKVVAKFGSPYFDNMIPEYRGYGKGVSCYQCCAYSFVDTPDSDPEFEEKLYFVGGKHFSMGSWQVVTINLPRAAYRAKGEDDALFEEVRRLMELCVEVFKTKYKWMRLMLENNRIPFATQRPKDPVTGEPGPPPVNFDELVWTVGLVGANEMAQYHVGYQLHESDEAVRLVVRLLLEMKHYLKELEEKHGLKLALARTPAESCAQRLAVCDLIDPEFRDAARKVVKGELEAGERLISLGDRDAPVYYSNGTHVYVGARIPLLEKLRIENKFFPILSGGNMFHVWLGQANPDPESLYKFTKRIATQSQIGYFAYTKDLTICEDCNKVSGGMNAYCPSCGSTNVRWWSRVTGYYQEVKGWNRAKKQEFFDRYRVSIP